MNVYDKAYELARAIRESQESREYKKVKNLVFNDTKNKEMILDFKKKQFELQAEQMSGKEPGKDKVENLQKLYSILIANSDVGKFFEHEYRFERLISDVYKILGEAIEVEEIKED